MQLRWTEAAAADLECIADYLFDHAPTQAARIVREIYEAPQRLLQSPYLGRTGTKAGTRELVLSSVPYLIVYSVTENTIHISRILHGAQKWP